MNATPTSGPIASSSTHQAREATSARHSLTTSHAHALRERKEDLLEVAVAGGERRQLVERPLPAPAPAAQQHEATAAARGVADLMKRQDQRSAGGGVVAERLRDLARLPQVEPVERLVGQQDRLRRQQSDAEQRAFALPLRQRADRRVEKRLELE